MIRFDNRVAVITGAGRGLGRDYAMFLASRGAKVVVNDLGRTLDGSGQAGIPAEAVVSEIENKGGTAIANFDDVSTPESAGRIIDAAMEAFGKVDILINNAGVLRDKTFAKMQLSDFEYVLKVHLMGTVYVTKAALTIMKEQEYGRLVFTSSAAGLLGNYGQTHYAAGKLGVVGLMNALKLEGERYNIKVNAIAPLAASRMAGDVFSDEQMKKIDPKYGTAAVADFCSVECKATGDIICAAGGHYARAQMMVSPGISLTPDAEASPEFVLQHYKEISDMAGAETYKNAVEYVTQTFELLSLDK